MYLRMWRNATHTWVEVSASTAEEVGMPAVLVKTETDGLAEAAQLTLDWQTAVEGRRLIARELRAKQVNVREGAKRW